MVLGKLLAFQGSIHISSVNLMTCMSSLTIIARARPQFLGKVVNALEILHGKTYFVNEISSRNLTILNFCGLSSKMRLGFVSYLLFISKLGYSQRMCSLLAVGMGILFPSVMFQSIIKSKPRYLFSMRG